MRISTIEEYGLRCALQLGRVYFFKEQHLAATEIAKREGISVRYVSKIMYLLRKAKLATAVRGTTGGFLLSKAPDQIASIFRNVPCGLFGWFWLATLIRYWAPSLSMSFWPESPK